MTDYEEIYRSFVKGRLDSFYALMYRGLLIFASRILGESSAFMAEDCVQDTVMSTYEHRAEIEDFTHWRWYLLQCIRNRALNILRHKGVAEEYCRRSAVAGDEGVAECDISYEMIRQETLDTLFGAIDRLPEQYREIFYMNFEQGLKTREIAELLDVAEITVKKRKARMLELLRAYIGGDAEAVLLLCMLIDVADDVGVSAV